MASGLRQIQQDLLDALRGRNGEPDDAIEDAEQAGDDPVARESRRRQRNGARASRPRNGSARAGGAGNGTTVFQDVRARARDLARGFREGGSGASDRLRFLRETPGTDTDDTGALREGGRGASISPPWRRTPTLPQPPGPPPPRNGRPRLKKLRLAVVVMGLILLALVSWFFGIMMSVAQDLPALENREQYKHAQNSVVLDRNGEQLATLTNNDRRILVPSEDISQTVKQAVVAVEDQRFYEHRGIDFQGIGRAIVQDVLQQNTVQGASTITQQFVKNALRAQGSRTVFQKLREAALAYHLERRWSKDKILTEYLNSIYFGEGAYGIEAAAQTYFGWNHPDCGGEETRCASVLAPEEAALLAGMISSPSAYSPRTNPEAATERRNLVLDRMVDQGVLTPEQYTELAGDGTENSGVPIPRPGQIEPPAENSQSPYFTTWLRQQVVDRYGAGEAFGGGLQITSTLDLEYQRAVEQIAYSTLAGIEPTASVAVIDNQTGGVLAMVGGNDYEKAPFNLATNGHRQPGSAFKPFTLVSALEDGHSPDEVFTSQPKTFDFKVPGYKKPQVFEVNNYEDNYLGSASIATATQYSDNSVFAELGLQVGPERIAKTAQEMGIQTKVSTNPAMILGGLETGVSPLEMAYAYSTLGRSGARIGGTMDSVPGSGLGPLGIMKVTTRDDDEETVEDKTGSSGENDVQTDQVLDSAAADTSVDLLENVVSGGTGENAATGDFAWGKTGTTDDNGDAWFCGGTEDITACVWVGHPNDVTPMETEYSGGPVDGGTYPADIWRDVVLAYDSIVGPDGEDEEDSTTDTGTDPGYVPPEESTAPAPAAPAPTEPAPTEPAPAAPEDTAPAPAAPPPTDGGTTDGGTGATGAAG
jgi:penicillin-binding protein 1A